VYLLERSKLYEDAKEHRKALEGYQTLLGLLSDKEVDQYFKLAWGLTRVRVRKRARARRNIRIYTPRPQMLTLNSI